MPIGFNPPESFGVKTWIPNKLYTQDQEVVINDNLYTADSTHTSGGDFATDLAAGKWTLVGSVTSSNGYPNIEKFIPTLGQTEFTMAGSPTPSIVPILTVNGTEYEILTDYTLSGSTLTWLDNLFTLDGSDVVRIYYSN